MNNSQKKLLEEVEAFLKATGMFPSVFGAEVMNDRHLVRRLRSGSDVTLGTADKIREFIKKNMIDADGKPAPSGRNVDNLDSADLTHAPQ
jgi:predicted Ser/Thr protein kinase